MIRGRHELGAADSDAKRHIASFAAAHRVGHVGAGLPDTGCHWRYCDYGLVFTWHSPASRALAWTSDLGNLEQRSVFCSPAFLVDKP